MRELTEALESIKGKNVGIYISHKLYGNQYIEVEFEPETVERIGFYCKDQVIYMNYDEITNYSISDKEVTINGEVMCITITNTQ